MQKRGRKANGARKGKESPREDVSAREIALRTERGSKMKQAMEPPNRKYCVDKPCEDFFIAGEVAS